MRRPGRVPVFLVAAVLSLLPATISAVQEEPEVRVIVDNPRPAADDVVRLTFSFTGPGVGGNLRAPATLPLKNLVVLRGPARRRRPGAPSRPPGGRRPPSRPCRRP